jgi:predicted amino acid racemase
MASLSGIVDSVTKLADMVDDYIPVAKNITTAMQLGQHVVDIIDTLTADPQIGDQPAMQERRKALAARVTSKSEALSRRLRGK